MPVRLQFFAAAAIGATTAAVPTSAIEPSDFDNPEARAIYCERVAEALGDEDAAADWFLAADMWSGAAGGDAGRRAALPSEATELSRQHVSCSVELASLQDEIEAHFNAVYGEEFGAPEPRGAPSDAVIEEFDGAIEWNAEEEAFEPEGLAPAGVEDLE